MYEYHVYRAGMVVVLGISQSQGNVNPEAYPTPAVTMLDALNWYAHVHFRTSCPRSTEWRKFRMLGLHEKHF
jgi:hypothetical protein